MRLLGSGIGTFFNEPRLSSNGDGVAICADTVCPAKIVTATSVTIVTLFLSLLDKLMSDRHGITNIASVKNFIVFNKVI